MVESSQAHAHPANATPTSTQYFKSDDFLMLKFISNRFANITKGKITPLLVSVCISV